MVSNRPALLNKLKELASDVGNQEYFVKRGVIDYTTIDWTLHKRTWAIMVDEDSIYNIGAIGDYPMQLTFEVFTTIPDNSTNPSLDDNLFEELRTDIVTVIDNLEKVTGLNGDPLVLRIKRSTGKFIEAYDLHAKIQGIIATIEISY